MAWNNDYYKFLILIISQAQYSLMTLGGSSEPQQASSLANVEIQVCCVASGEAGLNVNVF